MWERHERDCQPKTGRREREEENESERAKEGGRDSREEGREGLGGRKRERERETARSNEKDRERERERGEGCKQFKPKTSDQHLLANSSNQRPLTNIY